MSVEMVRETTPPEALDNDAASRQLLAETQASAMRPSHSLNEPAFSAIRNASLLNAARAEKRHPEPHTIRSSSPRTLAIQSSPADMVRRNGDKVGKLKRPSFLADNIAKNQRKNLSRRADVYELPESPEKTTQSPYKLPQTMNRQPLKVVKKVRGPHAQEGLDRSPSSTPVEDSRDHIEEEQALGLEDKALIEPQLPSSPPALYTQKYDEEKHLDLSSPHTDRRSDGALEDAQQVTSTGMRKYSRLAEEDADISRVDFAKQPGKKRKSGEQKDHKGPPSKSPRRKLPQPTQIERVDVDEEHISASAGHQEERLPKEADRKPTRRGRPRKTKKPTGRPVVEAKSADNVRGPISEPSNTVTASNQIPFKQTRSIAKGTLEEPLQPREQAQQGNKAKKPSKNERLKSVEVEYTIEPSVEKSEQKWRESNAVNTDDEDAGQIANIDCVFRFLDTEERSGKCQTNSGAGIKRVCQLASKALQESSTSLEEVSDNTEEIRGLLSVARYEKDTRQQRGFKNDAYAYLFRELTIYLELLNDWLLQRYDDVLSSLEAMRIIAPLIHDIISFKQTIASWKVAISQRYKGDRIVKDVDEKLLMPLRKVDQVYTAQLIQLEDAEKLKRTREVFRLRRKEKLEEQARKDELIALRKRKWERWQALHVRRMQVEPDPKRRLKLRITKFEDLEERDANGIKFERVPVFKERVSPPAYRSSALEEKEWTDEQMTALLDGLMKFSGLNVFEKIFMTYCSPGGVLRDLTVAEITAKATSIRFSLLEQYETRGWEVPTWLAQIPVLP